MEPSKRDWNLFRNKIITWQEAYMEKLVKAYTELMNDDLPASSKFWELEKQIKQDKNKPGVLLNLCKKDMVFDIIRLINDGAITMDELEIFSDELRDHVNLVRKNMEIR